MSLRILIFNFLFFFTKIYMFLNRYFQNPPYSIPDHLRQLAYSPNNAVVEEIVSKACTILGISQCDGFNSGLEMQTAMVNSSYLCGVDFGDHSKVRHKSRFRLYGS